MNKPPKRPRDPNQLGKLIVGMATGEIEKNQPEKDPAAVSLGKKGGDARAKKLSPKRRKEIAKNAAKQRWKESATSD